MCDLPRLITMVNERINEGKENGKEMLLLLGIQ